MDIVGIRLHTPRSRLRDAPLSELAQSEEVGGVLRIIRLFRWILPPASSIMIAPTLPVSVSHD